MTTTRAALATVLLALATACTTGPGKASRPAHGGGGGAAPTAYHDEAGSPGESAGAEAYDMEAPSPAPDRRPTERPGLGTEWGEQRRSRIEYVSFERCAPAPFATLAIHYNDEEGISAMADHDLRRGAGVGSLGVDPRGEITVAVVDEAGRPLPSLRVGGRVYVIGAAGQRYELRLANAGGARVEVVASVDGLDVIDGRAASPDKRGYIVDPGAAVTIEGFRTSADEVAAFRFGAVDDSYAARTGSARNVGVIGVALFCEQAPSRYARPPYDEREIELRQSADPFPGR